MGSVPWGYRALVVAVLVVLAGCALPSFSTTSETTEPPTASTPKATGTPMPDPPEDRIGWESGYWYNESLSLTPQDGYNRSELRRIVRRTMARVEVIRRLEFTDGVFLDVISRAEFRERNSFTFNPNPYQDQIYEALFLVGEDTHASERLEALYKGRAAGYYAGPDMVLISDDPDNVRIDRSVLAHELVHALQDDQFGTSGSATTFDGRRARRGLIEGEANYVQDRYEERCTTEWECIPRGSNDDPTPSSHRGLYLTVYVPYSEGPTLVGELIERGGWQAVDRAHDRPPVSTEQLIHPETYPDEEPITVRIENRSNGDWHRFGKPFEDHHERVGEAALYAMLWRNGVIPEAHLDTDDVRYNYSHSLAGGWDGDAVVPYRNGDRFGYVFVSVWETERDARQFHEAYLALLESRGASQVAADVYVIPDDDPFGDAFRVERRGDRIIVVNAPTVEELDEIHPRKE